jgi:ABC-type phosphate transport system substrate-binding protein
VIRFMLIAVLTVLVLGAAPLRADVVVVAHRDVPKTELDDQTLQRIYLGKKTRWNSDLDIVPVMLKSGLAHQEFVEGLLDRTMSRFVTFWKQAMFTGRGVPPRSFDTEEELMFYVARTPGAIGYVSAGTATTGLKVIAVD